MKLYVFSRRSDVRVDIATGEALDRIAASMAVVRKVETDAELRARIEAAGR